MKCLTICQPYAELIMRGEKRVENRKWPTSYRGTLLIHAGKSRQWLTSEYGIDEEDLVFGAIVGGISLVGCVDNTDRRQYRKAFETWPWLHTHLHAEQSPGFWWILEGPRRCPQPVPWRGQLGLFDVPTEEFYERQRKLLEEAAP